MYQFEENILIGFGEFQADSQIQANGKSTDELILHELQISENFYFISFWGALDFTCELSPVIPLMTSRASCHEL